MATCPAEHTDYGSCTRQKDHDGPHRGLKGRAWLDATAAAQWRVLGIGEAIQEGDEMYTWSDPDCKALGWITLPPDEIRWDPVVTEGMVPVRRRTAYSEEHLRALPEWKGNVEAE